jgi:hypothetical protein
MRKFHIQAQGNQKSLALCNGSRYIPNVYPLDKLPDFIRSGQLCKKCAKELVFGNEGVIEVNGKIIETLPHPKLSGLYEVDSNRFEDAKDAIQFCFRR